MKIDSFSKMQSSFFDVTLCNLIAEGTVPIFRKNCHLFLSFPFINTPSSNEDFNISHLPLFITTQLPARPAL